MIADLLMSESVRSQSSVEISRRGKDVLLRLVDHLGSYEIRWKSDLASFPAPPEFSELLKVPDVLIDVPYLRISDAIHQAVAKLVRLESDEQVSQTKLAILIDLDFGRLSVNGQEIVVGKSRQYYFDPRLVIRALEVIKDRTIRVGISPITGGAAGLSVVPGRAGRMDRPVFPAVHRHRHAKALPASARSQPMNSWVPPNTQRLWEQARRQAFIQDILSALTQRQGDLLPFDQVRSSLHLTNARYLGLQDVPLDQIVGSVGRSQDFTRAFFPRGGIARERWREIAHLTAIIDGNLPPVELYQVGQLYFVRDGNHRVSAARQQERLCIEAHVWEYETRVPLEPGIALEDLLAKAAYAAFLEHTSVDKHLCSDMTVELTQPEGYDDLLRQIEAFQYSLSRIDEREVPFVEAVALWCEYALHSHHRDHSRARYSSGVSWAHRG